MVTFFVTNFSYSLTKKFLCVGQIYKMTPNNRTHSRQNEYNFFVRNEVLIANLEGAI